MSRLRSLVVPPKSYAETGKACLDRLAAKEHRERKRRRPARSRNVLPPLFRASIRSCAHSRPFAFFALFCGPLKSPRTSRGARPRLERLAAKEHRERKRSRPARSRNVLPPLFRASIRSCAHSRPFAYFALFCGPLKSPRMSRGNRPSLGTIGRERAQRTQKKKASAFTERLATTLSRVNSVLYSLSTFGVLCALLWPPQIPTHEPREPVLARTD
ncbi:hypothetical protein Enr13x_60720 [Stieleria neptunia]|uniref:Uncharacterized protein n=1 Tax=Stieleria neptunia TaxID=2527979 RepID=A0A518HZ88_9BACT|nr:hypothetical protein Enr13x_60720 [Stieleria neptunia]